MASLTKESRYRWKPVKEHELFEFVNGKISNGFTVTAALKEYGEKHGVPWLTARWKYYQMKRRAAETLFSEEDTADVSKVGSNDDFLSALTGLIDSSQEIGEDIVTLMRGFSKMAALAREAAGLKVQLRNAVKDHDRNSEGIREIKHGFERLNKILTDWQGLQGVEKINSLSAFEQSLEFERDTIARAVNSLCSTAG